MLKDTKLNEKKIITKYHVEETKQKKLFRLLNFMDFWIFIDGTRSMVVLYVQNNRIIGHGIFRFA